MLKSPVSKYFALLFSFLVLFAGLSSITPNAYACSIAYNPDVSTYSYNWSDSNSEIFVGTVRSITTEQDGVEKVTFQVQQVLKGNNENTKDVYVNVDTGSSPVTSCGQAINLYKKGETYIVTPQFDTKAKRLSKTTLEFTVAQSPLLSEATSVDKDFFKSKGVELISPNQISKPETQTTESEGDSNQNNSQPQKTILSDRQFYTIYGVVMGTLVILVSVVLFVLTKLQKPTK